MNSNSSTVLIEALKIFKNTNNISRKFAHYKCGNVLLLQGFHAIEFLVLSLYPISNLLPFYNVPVFPRDMH